MKRKCATISSIMLFAVCAFTQSSATMRFVLFRGDNSANALAAKTKASSVEATEERAGNTLFQVFRSREGSRKELFRVAIGWYRDNPKDLFNKTWNYGISSERDFNGDGKPDYCWYGADDTDEEKYLFLSSDSGYKRVDIVKTTQAEWRKRFKTKSPDFGEVFGQYPLSSIVLERTQTGLILLVTVAYDPQDYRGKSANFQFRIAQADFVS